MVLYGVMCDKHTLSHLPACFLDADRQCWSRESEDRLSYSTAMSACESWQRVLEYLGCRGPRGNWSLGLDFQTSRLICREEVGAGKR